MQRGRDSQGRKLTSARQLKRLAAPLLAQLVLAGKDLRRPVPSKRGIEGVYHVHVKVLSLAKVKSRKIARYGTQQNFSQMTSDVDLSPRHLCQQSICTLKLVDFKKISVSQHQSYLGADLRVGMKGRQHMWEPPQGIDGRHQKVSSPLRVKEEQLIVNAVSLSPVAQLANRDLGLGRNQLTQVILTQIWILHLQQCS